MRTRRNQADFLDYDKITLELMKSKRLVERTPYRNEDIRQQALVAEKNIPILEETLRNAPPQPMLPPKNKLIKITGTINDLHVMKVKGYFTDREYDLEKSRKKEDRDQVGALVLSVIGNTTGAAVTAQDKTRMSDICDFVRGKINNIDFHGWLGLTSLKDGDYVEMAVSPDDGFYVVYAIANPARRTISMTPRCKYGVIAGSKDGMNTLAYFFIFVALLIILIGLFKEASLSAILFSELIYLIVICILLAVTRRSLIKKPSPTTQLAEAIFIALGMSNPSSINLEELTNETISKNSFNTETESKDCMPIKDSIGEYYYFY